MQKKIFIIPMILSLGLLGCANQAVPQAQFEVLSTVEIKNGDTPEMYGDALVAWYPELGKAIIGTQQSLRTQGNGDTQNKNRGSMRILETQKAASALGMPIGATGWATWGSGWATWGSGWATWGSGNGSVLSTGSNQATWSQINLAAARASFSRLGAGIKVAVIDTGIDLYHPAFANRLVPATEYYDFVDKDTIPQEVAGQAYGHGTNIAGIIAQIAEKAQIMPLRVLDENGIGDSDNVIAAINWAVQKGARIINLSLGTFYSEAVAVALDNATRRGVFVVTASGNSGDNDVNFPARACGSNGKNGRWGEMAISVGSVNRYDRRSKFSSYGKDDVGMTAPGETIYAPAPDNRVAAWSGTSMAAPMVAGSLALALGQRYYSEIGAVGKAIREKSRNIDNLNGDVKKEIGRGRLDLVLFAQELSKLK